MAHAIIDYSTPISCSVQTKEVLNMGPIAMDQLRKASCLEVVDSPIHHFGGHRWTSSRMTRFSSCDDHGLSMYTLSSRYQKKSPPDSDLVSRVPTPSPLGEMLLQPGDPAAVCGAAPSC